MIIPASCSPEENPLKQVRVWPEGSGSALQDCLDWTDMFKKAATENQHIMWRSMLDLCLHTSRNAWRMSLSPKSSPHGPIRDSSTTRQTPDACDKASRPSQTTRLLLYSVRTTQTSSMHSTTTLVGLKHSIAPLRGNPHLT